MRLITAILFFVSIHSFSQNKIIFDEKYNDSLLIGKCTIEAFEKQPYYEWFSFEYQDYTPNDSIINLLKNTTDSINITIILGVWCSDSRREFPRFMKILNLINYDFNKLNIICVDTDKKADKIDLYKYNIKLVPTFIFYKNNFEIGRIIETPNKTLETDFKLITCNKL